MARTSNIYVRVEPDIKSEAESILKELGIPMSNAVAMFLRQVILQRGIPFEMKIPEHKLLNYDLISDEDFADAINLAERDFDEGRVWDSKELREEMKRVYGI